ncbi:MAG: hypothetical protein RLZ81_3333, partial [Pseudomonadota bacterium]
MRNGVWKLATLVVLSAWSFAVMAQSALPPVPVSDLYQQHCASCHGAQRTGLMGPALLPESLERLRKPEALKTIAAGRAATQMPGFQGTLSAQEMAALAQWIYTPTVPAPRWTDSDIRASRVQLVDAATLPATPSWSADPMNLFVVVEGG